MKSSIKKGDRVILENRGTRESGVVLKMIRREEVFYYDVLTDRGVTIERITTQKTKSCHINEMLTIKYNKK